MHQDQQEKLRERLIAALSADPDRQEALDDLVCDIASQIASEINNRGKEAQCRHLAVATPPEDTDLDDLVHDSLERAASETNNAGIEAQIDDLHQDAPGSGVDAAGVSAGMSYGAIADHLGLDISNQPENTTRSR